MDAMAGRSQTTKGIWAARSPHLDRCTVLIDCEGSDGRERGEDDSFEKKSALFALGLADVVLINLWCHDIGREQGAGKPLLKTVLQVNLKLFRPSRKTTLLFVIRDKSITPLERLEEVLMEDMLTLWGAIEKPSEYANSRFRDLFDTRFEAMPSFEKEAEAFERAAHAIRAGFQGEAYVAAAAEEGRMPGSAFAVEMAQMWRLVKENKDINIPAHRILVARVRCDQIVQELVADFASDPAWAALREADAADASAAFGERLERLFALRAAQYDDDTELFNAEVRAEFRKALAEGIFDLARPAYAARVECASAAAIEALRTAAPKFGRSEFADRMRSQIEASIKVSAPNLPHLPHHTMRSTPDALDSTSRPTRRHARLDVTPDSTSRPTRRHARLDVTPDSAPVVRVATGRLDPYPPLPRVAPPQTLSSAIASLNPPSSSWSPTDDLAPARAALVKVSSEILSARVRAELESSLMADLALLTSEIRARLVERGGDGCAAYWAFVRASERALVARASADADETLAGFELDQHLLEDAKKHMNYFVRATVARALSRMSDQADAVLREAFTHRFAVDESGAPRSWLPGVDIPRLAEKAKLACIGVLAGLR